MRFFTIAPICLVVAAATGCATGAKTLDLRERTAYRALKQAVVAPVNVHLGIDVLDAGTSAGKVSESSWRVRPDAKRIAKWLRRYINDLGLVATVGEGVDGAGAILEVRPMDARVSYKGFNNYVYGNSALLLFGGMLAWWVPDESWTGEVDWEMVLRDAQGKELASAPIGVTHQQELSDFDRGWDFMSAMFLWGFTPDGDSFSAAAGLLMPQAEATAMLRVCETLATGDFRDALYTISGEEPPVKPEEPPVKPEKPPVKPEKPPVKPEKPPVKPEKPPVKPEQPTVTPTRAPIRRALIVGVEIDQASVAPDEVAISDAGRTAQLISEWPVRAERNAEDRLTGENATLAKFKARLNHLKSRRLTRDDQIALYFAGRGTVLEGGRPALVFDDGDPEKGDNCIALEDIHAALKPAKVVMFLDTSFNGWAETRGPGVDVPEMKLPTSWKSATDLFIFVAAKEGSAETTFVEDPAGDYETGIFSGGVRSLLGGAGDANGDNLLTAAEATQALKRHVDKKRGASDQAEPSRLAGASDARLWTVR